MPGGRESPRRRERRSRSLSSSSSNYKGRSRSPRRSYSRKSRSPSSSESPSPYRRRRSFDHSSPPQHGPPGHYGYKTPYYGRRPRRPRGFFPRGRGQMRGRGRGFYYNNYSQHPRGREPNRESPHRSRSGNSDSDRESPPLKRQRPFRPRGEEEEFPETFRRQDASRHSFDRDRGRRQESSFSPTRARPSFGSEGRRGAFEEEPKPGPSSFSRSSPPPHSPYRSEEGKKVEAAGVFFDSRSLTSVRPPSSISTGALSRKMVVRRTLDERFSQPGERAPDLEENITIAIQRNPSAKISSSSTVRKLFDPDLFAILRRKDEGKKPLFERPEIEMFGHDLINEEGDSFERRVIQVVPPHHSPRQQAVQVIHTDYKSSASDDKPSTSWQHSFRTQRPDHYVPSHSREEYMETDRFRDRSAENPGDLRHNLSRRRFDNREDLRAGPPRYRGREEMEEEDRGRRPGQRDFNPALDRGRDDRFEPRRMERMDELPDVSRRPDKFRQTTDWVDNPEMVPKGSSYFEHDDRDEKRPFGMRRPFRSRPFIRGFRPRGNFRGNPRGGNPNYRGRGYVPRGNYRGGDRDRQGYQGTRSDWGEWKHDMFDKLEGEEDKEPSSTTKP